MNFTILAVVADSAPRPALGFAVGAQLSVLLYPFEGVPALTALREVNLLVLDQNLDASSVYDELVNFGLPQRVPIVAGLRLLSDPEGTTEPPAPAPDDAEGPLQIDRVGRRVLLGVHEARLSSQKFDLLCYFVDHAGRAVTARDLVRLNILRPSQAGRFKCLVRELRQALRFTGGNFRAVPGYGYRYEPPTATVADAADAANWPHLRSSSVPPSIQFRTQFGVVIGGRQGGVGSLAQTRRVRRSARDPDRVGPQ